MVRKSICCCIRNPKLVNDIVLQAHQLCTHLELPWSMESLVSNMRKAVVISKDDKLEVLEIGPPLLRCNDYGQELFFIR